MVSLPRRPPSTDQSEVTAAVILFRLLTWLLIIRSGARGTRRLATVLSSGLLGVPVPGDDRATSTAPRRVLRHVALVAALAARRRCLFRRR